jgi:hypothetical protein
MPTSLRPPYTNSATFTVGQTMANIPIVQNFNTNLWVIEQITITYSAPTDNVNVTIYQNGVNVTGSPMVPGAVGLTQTFSGVPPIYMEASDDVVCSLAVTGTGSSGAQAIIYVSYREIGYDSDELDGRF